MTEIEQDKNRIKSVEKALDILLLFSREKRELSHAEISRQMGWSTSTTSRFLGTLLEKDFLAKNDDNGKYRLGTAVFCLGAIVRNNSDFVECARPVMERLGKKTNETVHLFVRSGIHRVCIDQIDSTHRVRISSEIGLRDALWIGSTGRVLLAFTNPEKTEQLFESIHMAQPEVDIEQLKQKVERVKMAGFARKDGEWDRHCACIAAPVFNREGELLGSLGISVPDFRFPKDDSEYVQLVIEGAKEVSYYMGWTK